MSRLRVGLTALVALSCSFLPVPSLADSQVRIVRLKDVQGDVQFDRNTGQGFEKAFLNLPITQGVKIQTKMDGLASVEFEDGSTVRITPGTVVDFPELSLRDSGAKISTVHVQEGTAYIHFVGAKDDEFTLTFGHEKAALTHPAHLRVSLGDTEAKLAVYNGDVTVVSPSDSIEVSKDRTVTFDLADQDHYKLAKDIASGSYDAWDKKQDEYEQTYSASTSAISPQSAYSPYQYGSSDLNYYGSFSNYPGYGALWQPYFIGAGWDPFMNGAWAFYPGAGYSWVSGYPWGWTPYHTGTWVFVPGYGWAWQPGGTWNGLHTVPRFQGPTTFRPPRSPSSGQGTVLVSRGPVPLQLGRSFNHLEIMNNSAGLGIPPGSIKNLGGLSNTVERTGFATTKLHVAPVGNSGWFHGGGYSGMGSPAMHSGSAGGHISGGGHSGGMGGHSK